MMIEFGHFTHVGLRRKHNEDTYYGNLGLGLWLVADGMGGHEFGEVAAAMARDAVAASVKEGKTLPEAILHANQLILKHSEARKNMLPMGTTIAAITIKNQRFSAAWVGDSRIYLWDGLAMRQLSQDHSYVQELIDQGAITADEARGHPHRNVITQALGVTNVQSLRIEQLEGILKPGMQLLLCTDGLTEEVDDATIAHILSQDLPSAQECVDHLIQAALQGGGSDNVTAMVLRAS